ncbi:MAG: TRAP transporter small permease [Gammaproteobacteria bacterium]|nr:TRAP transporter small permease [Gammaproteobacteria bacterium]
MNSINRYIDVFEKYTITVGFAVATLVLFTNVVLRYVFNTGLLWALEFVQYVFAWVVLIGAAHGVKVGIHLGIDILLEKLPPVLRQTLLRIAVVICIAFVAIVDYEAFRYMIRIYQWGDLTEDLRIPQWIPYIAIPLGMTLMLYHFLVLAWDIFRGRRDSIHARESHRKLEELEQ